MSTHAERPTACEDRVPDLVDLAVDGGAGLSRDARLALEHHVVTCAGCRAELATLREETSALTGTRVEPEPLHLAGFASRTADRAESFRDRSPRGLWWALTRGMRLALFGSTAALAAAVALVLSIGAPPPSPAPSVPVAAPVVVAVEDEPADPEDALVLEEGDETEGLVRQAMREPSGLGADSAFEALDDELLEDVLLRLQVGG